MRFVRSEASRTKQGTSPVRRDPRSSTKAASRLGNLPLALRGLATMAMALPAVAYADPNEPESSYDFADSFSTQPGVRILVSGKTLNSQCALGETHWNPGADVGSWHAFHAPRKRESECIY